MANPLTNNLTPERALIFRITHISNIPWILDHGLASKNSGIVDPDFIAIGNPDLIARRASRAIPIPPGGMLSDYIPFYFTPYSPMMLNITTGYGGITQRTNAEIAILVSSLYRVAELGGESLFTDRHAYLEAANFYSDPKELTKVDFALIQTKDFKRDSNDPSKGERYQAEALIKDNVPVDAIIGIGCFAEAQERSISMELRLRDMAIPVYARPNWYF